VIVHAVMEGCIKNCIFRPISLFISETIPDMAIVIMEDEFYSYSFAYQYSYAIYRLVPFLMTLHDA